jgi:adsorption protein B
MTELLTLWHLLLAEALLLVGLGFVFSGLDDLLVDCIYFMRLGWRRLTVYRRHPRADVQALMGLASPAPIAILVPAWDESAVIGHMLRHLTARIDYPDYRVFVGIYPNDPVGAAVVAVVGDPRVQQVRCVTPGPTSKADCLNQLWAAARRHEMRCGRHFKVVVLHDAEDVVHAQELHLFNALVPRLALVQLPVRPLPDLASRWVSGHYLDEFAEAHGKDLIVREALGAAVPSAGVATGLDRDMLAAIADARGGAGPFDAASLTEDYELGHRVRALGGRTALVRLRSRGERLVVATREHFPATFDAAVRQKSRWLAGIALAGWDRIGWPPGIATRYMLLRDRKAVFTALLGLAGYGVAGLVLADALLRALLPAAALLPPLVAPGSGLALLLLTNVAMFGWRLLMRAGFTWVAHGWREGIRAVPRALVANIINAAAALAAIRRYRKMRASGSSGEWGKTLHRFPGAAGLAE